MSDDDRGKIRTREYAQQLRDFSGLRFGTITPTDIDGMMEFGDKDWIFFEVKHGDAQMPRGQKLCLERTCDALQDAKRNSIVLVASHNTDGDIPVAELPVTLLRHGKTWRTPRGKVTMREAIEGYLAYCDNMRRRDTSRGSEARP